MMMMNLRQIGGDGEGGGGGVRPLDRPTLVRPARMSLQHEHALSSQQQQQQQQQVSPFFSGREIAQGGSQPAPRLLLPFSGLFDYLFPFFFPKYQSGTAK